VAVDAILMHPGDISRNCLLAGRVAMGRGRGMGKFQHQLTIDHSRDVRWLHITLLGM